MLGKLCGTKKILPGPAIEDHCLAIGHPAEKLCFVGDLMNLIVHLLNGLDCLIGYVCRFNVPCRT